jgi:hypothetical protein
MRPGLIGKTEGKNHLEDLGRDARIILKRILKIGWQDVDWIYVAQ